MSVWEGKQYKLEKSENFDEYMVALGVSWLMRKMGNSATPTVELIKSGDTYTLNTLSTFKNTAIVFKLGEEFEEETADGRTVKTRITMNGNTFTQSQFGSKPTTIVRVFTEKELIATCRIGDITCVRTYKAVV